jgi:hypothetical protein
MSEAKKIVHDGKKNALGIVFGSAQDDDKDEPPESQEDMGDEGDDEDFEHACDEAMQALKANDKEGFCEALKAAIDIRMSGEDREEHEEAEEHE